ncbi:MAG TPA: ABC transporter permease [Sphingobium sp.]|nr:ABC transporter permease [Sphingobium sp.]
MLVTSFLLALRAIRRHLMRSFLTTLGIIIGVAAVVTMVTLGNGATQSVQSQISSLGSNLLNVSMGGGFGRGGGAPPKPFDEEDVQAVRDQVGGVLRVAPQAQSSVTAVYEAQNWSTTVNGTTNDYFAASNIDIVSGRMFTAAEEQAGKSVCVLGDTVKENLFRDVDPLGKTLRLKDISCSVVGVMAKRGQAGFGGGQDDSVVMPIKAVMRRLTGNRDIRSFQVAVDQAYDTTAVSASITKLLRERRRTPPGQEDSFNIFDAKQISDTLSGATRTMTALLASVAAVSLVVGGIGIMNIMLVSVTERTREIGIRLAIGAVQREVLMQFLVEAVTLSALGGLVGLILAFGLTVVISGVMNIPLTFDLQINLLAFGFAALIGVIFGYVPARRAAGLNPIEALRHE